MTNEDIERIWSEVEWRDLCPVAPGFNEALRVRFARAIRVDALAEAMQFCIDVAHKADRAGLQQHADASAHLAKCIAELAKG